MTQPPTPRDPGQGPEQDAAGRPDWYTRSSGSGSSATWPDGDPQATGPAFDGAGRPADDEQPAATPFGAPSYGAPSFGAPSYSADPYPAGPHAAGPHGAGGPAGHAPAAYAPGHPVQQDSGNGLSIASFVVGILSIIGGMSLVLPPIAGVILGHMALKREPAGRGMAIAGLVLNYLSLVLLLLLVVFVVLFVVLAAANSAGY